MGARRPLDRLVRERRTPTRHERFHLVVDTMLSRTVCERAREQGRCRVPTRRGGRPQTHRRGARPHDRHESRRLRDRPRPLRAFRQARAHGVDVRGLRRPFAPPSRCTRMRGASTGRRRRSAALRGLEGDGRVPRARVPAGAEPRVRHRPALQHRGAAPERPVRHGRRAVRAGGGRRRAARDPTATATRRARSATCRTRSARSRA